MVIEGLQGGRHYQNPGILKATERKMVMEELPGICHYQNTKPGDGVWCRNGADEAIITKKKEMAWPVPVWFT